MIFKILFVFYFIHNYCDGRTSEVLKVTLPNNGRLVGRYLTSQNGTGFRAFMGVPYAEPPIGELRFKAPVAIKAWSGEKQVTEDSPICIQRDPYRRDTEIEGSEDCLYLNVFTPLIPQESNDVLPVMVFFHGGGWQCGSGISSFYGPDFLMNHKIIMVVANFRLGPLGFLSTGQKDCPGNNGLKDQVMVLRWIRENIASFGGDPGQVTIFGESAGGASGTYHMMSPLSKGYFQKTISQSGTNLAAWAAPAQKDIAVNRAKTLAKMMDCYSEEEKWNKILNCLRQVSAEKITAAYYDFFEWDTDPMIPFPPVVEPDLPGAFITEHPRDVITPHGLDIPWITGITMDEGVMKSAAFIHSDELRQSLNDNWDRALPISLYYDHHEADIQNLMTTKINDFYFKNRKFTAATEQNLTNLYTDAWFLAGMDEYLRIRLSNNKNRKIGTTYVYLFAHKATASFTEIFKGGRENYYGVCHAEELQYLFPIGKELFISAVPSEDDIRIRNDITEMWVNFAKTGNPTPDGSNLIKWNPATDFPLEYLRIGNKDEKMRDLIEMEKGLLEDRSEFWRNLKAHHSSKSIQRDEL